MRFFTNSPFALVAASIFLTAGALPTSESTVDASVAAADAALNNPTAKTKNGTYVGRYLPQYNEDLFLGVPYAQPPVGDLRFRNPVSLNTSFTGKRMSTDYAPSCVGYGSDQWGYPISEDCLYLNVIRPTGTKPSSKLPVGVWIHGGGYFEGGSRDQRYNSSFIVQNSVEIGLPMIVVSINYRLSAWGFLAGSDIGGQGYTNMGLRDQRLALHWVQENIAAFGGDPSQVTIWGESAGASSVGYHLTAYNGRDDNLFRAAIMESGGPIQLSPLNTADFQNDRYQALLASVDCTNVADQLACLREMPFDALNTAINTTAFYRWFPYIDGDFVARYGSEQLAEGDFVHVPIIIGASSDEGTAFGPYGLNTEAEFIAGLEDGTIFPAIPLQPTVAEQLVASYPDDPCVGIPATLGCLRPANGSIYGAEFRRTSAYAGDAQFIAPRRLACQTWAAAGVQAYCYRYNGYVNGMTPYLGVTHFQEIGMVFYNLNGVGYDVSPNPFANRGPSFPALAKLMSCSWASFIATKNPNRWRETDTKVPLWPVYNVAKPRDIVWDANITTYLEADTYRALGMATINSFNVAFRR